MSLIPISPFHTSIFYSIVDSEQLLLKLYIKISWSTYKNILQINKGQWSYIPLNKNDLINVNTQSSPC
jgi:hypothetical protein